MQTKYVRHQSHMVALEQDIFTLDSLKQLTAPQIKDTHTIKKLEITVPIHKAAYERTVFLYYKTGGMLLVLFFMGSSMVLFNYISNKRKLDSKNKKVDFTFDDPDNDAIGQRISWVGIEGSASNFASETLKKTRHGYKITSSALTRVFAWSFFLIGLNYVVLSYVKYYQISEVSFNLMKLGKIFFTSRWPVLINRCYSDSYVFAKSTDECAKKEH
ncbi:hypothetical protein N7U66_19405 [Lacinutrix neustonica]|uniref:Uncharacterized protein n=1 Tax=Lacinutrix neustonica TaxID=2980107 RepID=A0A9E8MV67_9FLAO|nr:hypothetical protein [Lacinutrix neustonica]WAC01976.1 hypothetical protein N7U66_19405 [Lacinutrix neustonica]